MSKEEEILPIFKNRKISVQEPAYIALPTQSKLRSTRFTPQTHLQKILKMIFKDMKNVSLDFTNKNTKENDFQSLTPNEFFRIFSE